MGRMMAPNGQAVMQITASSCPPLLHYTKQNRAYCERHNDETFARLVGDPRIQHVILMGNLQGYPEDARPAVLQALSATAEGLAAAGKHVVIVKQIPIHAYSGPVALGLMQSRGLDPRDWSSPASQYDRVNAAFLAGIDQIADGAEGIEALSPRDLYCRGGRCRGYDPKYGSLYFNDNHLSIAGSQPLASEILARTVQAR